MNGAWDFENTVYPGTDVLVNRLGIRNAERLHQFETRLVAAHGSALRDGVGLGDVTTSYDLRHLSDLHRALYSDLYLWAGQPRTCEPPERAGQMLFLPSGEIAAQMDRVKDVVRGMDWAGLGEQELAGQLGAVYTAAFHTQPFRHGNAEAVRAFADAVASHSRFEVDWDRQDPRAWAFATVDAMPREPGKQPDPRPFTEVIHSSLRPRVGEPAPLPPPPPRDLVRQRLQERVGIPGAAATGHGQVGASALGARPREAERLRDQGRSAPQRSGPSV